MTKSTSIHIFTQYACILFCSLMLMHCQPAATETYQMEVQPTIVDSIKVVQLTKDSLYDRVLGFLVGSAIGDAMGAPTEMWERHNIKVEYGFIDSLTDMIRELSPEGTWDFNLSAGGTTDDTRWKVLLSRFFLSNPQHIFRDTINSSAFASFIVQQYTTEIEKLKKINTFDPAPIEMQSRRLAWLQEWAVVAKPFAENDITGYNEALHHFYGGEMTCAGQLYTPMIGLAFMGDPLAAYQAAYKLSIFDIGYARDISGLTAAMVAVAMQANPDPNTILNVIKEIDPQQYFNSRLIGRTAYRIYKDALYLTYSHRELTNSDSTLHPQLLDSLYKANLPKIFEALDQKNQDVAFHAGEIFMINLTAMLYSGFDFKKTLAFIINYGRDNDTVGAIAGSILGALYGFEQLPKAARETVLKTNKEKLGIDLLHIADQLTQLLITERRVSLLHDDH